MLLYIFFYFQKWVLKNTKFNTFPYIKIAKKLAIFIDIVGQDVTNRGVYERFEYSGQIVGQCFLQILNILIKMHAYYV